MGQSQSSTTTQETEKSTQVAQQKPILVSFTPNNGNSQYTEAKARDCEDNASFCTYCAKMAVIIISEALSEKDLLNSLSVSPNQPYVINYLAYSWIEKGINIKKSLEMLKKANELKKNDGYIIDSLGWALFKLKKFKEAKKYLCQTNFLIQLFKV